MSKHPPVLRDRIDPESAQGLQAYLDIVGPQGINGIPDLGARRARMRELTAAQRAQTPSNPRVEIQAQDIPGLAGDPDVPVRRYRRASAQRAGSPETGSDEAGAAGRPGVLFIHGGGMVLGDLDEDEASAILIADELDAVVVSVGYRLAPEDPFPAGTRDCLAGLRWLAGHADELGVDPDRLAVYGGSAGGGLAIATCLLNRDCTKSELTSADPGYRADRPVNVAFLMAIYPMIDDRECTSSSQSVLDLGAWDRDGNREAWGWYVGRGAPTHLEAYAAPARAVELADLPATFIDVGDLDLFRDEDIDFAARLMQAGVPCELHVYPGSYHASELIAPDASLSQVIIATRLAALRRALHDA